MIPCAAPKCQTAKKNIVTDGNRKYMSLLEELACAPRSENPMIQEVRASIEGLAAWVEKHKYRAYDPGDGNLSYLRHLTFGTHFLRRVLTASVLRTPFHIRPWIGIRPHTSTKGMGYMGWGYVKMYATTRDESYRRRAELCFDWLMENRAPGGKHYCWGNHFAFATRGGTTFALTPTIVWSSLIGFAFLEAYEVLGESRYLEVAASTAEWVKALPREKTSRGLCISYVPEKQESIHNSNMLGAALLACVCAHTGDQEMRELAGDAMTYSCARQNADGAWYYGDESMYHWIDNFHTGYNLDCLKRYMDSTGDTHFEANFREGYEYYVGHFFDAKGRPKYYHDKAGPIDIQCAAQSIDTLTFCSDIDEASLDLALKVARWTICNMQARDGHFYYRDLGWKKIKTPMFHWGQGTMFKALAHLLNKLTVMQGDRLT